MQTVLPSEFRRGMALMLDGVPNVVEELHAVGTAQFKQRLRARLRNLKTGRLTDRVFADHERVAVADLEHRNVQFSYRQGETYVFLDGETYEPLEVLAERVGERRWFLKENEEYRAIVLEGKLLDVELPDKVALQVTETAPPLRGGSDAVWKPAKLETGLDITVPLFIGVGDRVIVDTRERKYVGKEG